jgi:GH25 family lysozyme M1 (1,4-beta-N-acetylmuramidase)
VVDVSHYEGVPDWDTYAAAHRSDVGICEATKGTEFVDSTFQQDRQDLSKLGFYCGLYHFAGTPATGKIADPVTEAKAYLKAVGPLGPKEFPILDFEQTYKMSSKDQIAWMAKWLDYVQKATGKTPWVYSYDNFLKDLEGPELQTLTKYPLWEANYPKNDPNPDPTKPPDTHGWPQLMAWQYSESQTVPGVSQPCDDSYLYGNIAAAVEKTSHRHHHHHHHHPLA